MAQTKLNRKGSAPTVETVAANHGLQLGTSMNGNVQFVKDSMQHLYELTVSSLFGKDTYYRSSNQLVEELRKEVAVCVVMDELDFIANVAVHARTTMLIRTMPIVLVVEFAKQLRDQGKQYGKLRLLVCDVIQRADQINDMYAYALEVFGSKNAVPMAIKRGVGDALNKFNEYHFAKYNRDGGVKFRDVLRIVHPEAKDTKQGFIFEKIMKDTLEVPYTWEVELSKNGQLPEAERKSKKQLWTELVSSSKLGYMALLRNLRNICEAEIDKDIMLTHVCNVLSNPKLVANSKQFPFAFVQAYKAVETIAPTALKKALTDALEMSCKNIPQLGDNVVLLVDASGSMQGGFYHSGGYGDHAGWAPADQSAVLAAALIKANAGAYSTKVIYFHSSAEEVTIDVSLPIMKQAQLLRDKSRGGSTNLSAAFTLMRQMKLEPDALIVLSDMEVDHCGSNLRPEWLFNKTGVRIAVNLNGSSTTPLASKMGWYQLSGWSDKMFSFIPAMHDKESVVDRLCGPYMGVKVGEEDTKYQPKLTYAENCRMS